MLTLSQSGFVALHVACQEGHAQVAELLLQAEASVEQETEVRWSVGQACFGNIEQCTYTPPSLHPFSYTTLSQNVGEVVYLNI